ncbi:hypothetical protein [Gordonia paraffinivorans]|uniref:hypothetical protein n=1 Tax=Gordonia paraffinivorans TaxID=175628 RepID=UPI003FCEAF79
MSGKHRLDEAQDLAHEYGVPYCMARKNGLKYFFNYRDRFRRPEFKPLQSVKGRVDEYDGNHHLDVALGLGRDRVTVCRDGILRLMLVNTPDEQAEFVPLEAASRD